MDEQHYFQEPISMTSGSKPPPNHLKRKRQLLPLGIPPSPISSTTPSEQRTVLRVNRACNTCRRQKMRCDGPDKGAACARCQHAGVECVFEKVPANKPPAIPATSRLTSLESKMEIMQDTQIQMQNSIQEILTELRRRPIYPPPDASFDLANTPTPEAQQRAVSSHVQSAAHSSRKSATSPSVPYGNPSSPRLASIIFKLNPLSSPSQLLLSPCHTPSDHSVGSSSDYQVLPDISRRASDDNRGNFVAEESAVSSNDFQIPSHTSTLNTSSFRNDVIVHHNKLEFTPQEMRISSTQDGSLGMQSKIGFKRIDTRKALREDGEPVWNPDDPIKDFSLEDIIYPDPISRESLSEAEARDLFALFFDQCHPRMPIFDPAIDSFDSLRYRSLFCFCCVLMVATKTRDGGKSPSALQVELWNECLMRAKESMFQRVKELEVIQGLILVSSWSESTGGTCWIVAGHAIRCAVEMGLHKALAKLASASNTVDEKTQILVSSARVWCAIFAFEYQLSFGIGRHTMTGHPRSIKNARETLLNHPLSHPSDMRVVSACELMLLEHQLLETLPSTDANDVRYQHHLREGRARMDAWYSHWKAKLSEKYPPEHYMLHVISIQKNFGYMTVHMAGMTRIITSEDLKSVSSWERENCFYAVSAAKEIVRISVEEPSYRDGLRYSPTCFYSGVSFVGACILRLGSILSDDQDQLNLLVLELYRVLMDVPTCRFKFTFVTLLKEKNLLSQDHLAAASGESMLHLNM